MSLCPDYVLFASGGNDSVALVQYCRDFHYENIAVAYSNTGWAASWWPQRMERFKAWVESLSYSFHEIPSEGMEALIDRKKGWPANRPKFCTYELKIKPAQAWLEQIDPEKKARCLVGIRRSESYSRRAWPELIPESANHGGRDLESPMVNVDDGLRNELLAKAGWAVLPHRSKECSPCVNANRADFRHLGPEEINRVRENEKRTGRNMFRPHRFHGAKGIDEVMRWANSPRGHYNADQLEMSGCDSGMCGD